MGARIANAGGIKLDARVALPGTRRPAGLLKPASFDLKAIKKAVFCLLLGLISSLFALKTSLFWVCFLTLLLILKDFFGLFRLFLTSFLHLHGFFRPLALS
jgi:hypothetical protein